MSAGGPFQPTTLWKKVKDSGSPVTRRRVALMKNNNKKKEDKQEIGLETEMEESGLGYTESEVLAEHPSRQIQKGIRRLWLELGEQRCRSSIVRRKGWVRLRKSPFPPRALPEAWGLASPLHAVCPACWLFFLSRCKTALTQGYTSSVPVFLPITSFTWFTASLYTARIHGTSFFQISI